MTDALCGAAIDPVLLPFVSRTVIETSCLSNGLGRISWAISGPKVLNASPKCSENLQKYWSLAMSMDFTFGPFVLDRQRGRLLRDGRPVAVSSKGLRLLEALLGSPGRVLTKNELMQAAWGDTVIEESNLSVQIAALRKQLGPISEGGDWITTIPRVGY